MTDNVKPVARYGARVLCKFDPADPGVSAGMKIMVMHADHEAAIADRDARIAEVETRLELVTKERDHIQRKLETTQHENKEAFASWRDFQQLASERYEENKSLRTAIKEKARELETEAEKINPTGYECAGELAEKSTLERCAAELRSLEGK